MDISLKHNHFCRQALWAKKFAYLNDIDLGKPFSKDCFAI